MGLGAVNIWRISRVPKMGCSPTIFFDATRLKLSSSVGVRGGEANGGATSGRRAARRRHRSSSTDRGGR